MFGKPSLPHGIGKFNKFPFFFCQQRKSLQREPPRRGRIDLGAAVEER
jgi:hypothetical protein